MKKITQLLVLTAALLFSTLSNAQTPVEKHGQLSIDGIHIVDEKGNTVQFKGMSFFWSQWMDQYYTKKVVKTLANDWQSGIMRIAMGVDMGGYLENPEVEMKKVDRMVKYAVQYGLYVIIDYHAHKAHENTEAAKKFFAQMAQKYGQYPNVIYETFNEPLDDVDWATQLKPYHEAVIDTIRHYDPDNIIVCGTKRWSQLVDEPAADPIDRTNIAYTLHFYANTHRQDLRDIAKGAIDKGICLFVTEFGTCSADGNGDLNYEEMKKWSKFMDRYQISWCNWSVADKKETASILMPEANTYGYWPDDQLTDSGKLIKSMIKGTDQP